MCVCVMSCLSFQLWSAIHKALGNLKPKVSHDGIKYRTTWLRIELLNQKAIKGKKKTKRINMGEGGATHLHVFG